MKHPAPLSCLIKAYDGKPGQKGGTLIAEGVTDLEEHLRSLADPDGYRPACCPTCGQSTLHCHDFRERLLRGDPDAACTDIRRYLCTMCGAVWQVLPAFIARHLHRSWRVIQSAMVRTGVLERSDREQRVSLPSGTVQRWRSRLCSCARILTQALAGIGADVVLVLKGLCIDCTRGELVDALSAAGLLASARRLAELACWIHRVAPGVRVM
jgi:transposase-like protein